MSGFVGPVVLNSKIFSLDKEQESRKHSYYLLIDCLQYAMTEDIATQTVRRGAEAFHAHLKGYMTQYAMFP